MNRVMIAWVGGFVAGVTAFWIGSAAAAQGDAWPWSDALDAVAAAPDSHEVLIDNDWVRVLHVVVPAGEKEPAHTHKDSSVMISYQPTRIRYYGADGELLRESPPGPRPANASQPRWLEPEGLHAVENVDTMDFKAYRIELKQTPSADD